MMSRHADSTRLQGRISMPDHDPCIPAEGVVRQDLLQGGKQFFGIRSIQVNRRLVRPDPGTADFSALSG